MAASELNPGWHIRVIYSKWGLRWAAVPAGGGMASVPRLFNFTLTFTLKVRKITVKHQSGWSKYAMLVNSEHVSMSTRTPFFIWQRLVGWNFVLLSCTSGNLRRPSVSLNICRVVEIRVSPHQLHLSRNSRIELWYIPQRTALPNPLYLASHWCTKVHQ
jgi:hypothetical protein